MWRQQLLTTFKIFGNPLLLLTEHGGPTRPDSPPAAAAIAAGDQRRFRVDHRRAATLRAFRRAHRGHRRRATTAVAPAILVTGADAGGAGQMKVFDAATGQLKSASSPTIRTSPAGARRRRRRQQRWHPDIITALDWRRAGHPRLRRPQRRTPPAVLRLRHELHRRRLRGRRRCNGGFADIICGAAPAAHLNAFSGRTAPPLTASLRPGLTGGVRVAAGDTTGSGMASIITGGSRRAERHRASWSPAQVLQSYLPRPELQRRRLRGHRRRHRGDGRRDCRGRMAAGAECHVFNGADGASRALLRPVIHGRRARGGRRPHRHWPGQRDRGPGTGQRRVRTLTAWRGAARRVLRLRTRLSLHPDRYLLSPPWITSAQRFGVGYPAIVRSFNPTRRPV